MADFGSSAENVSRTIQLIIAPTVMITACCIMLGGLLGRFATINDRLRSMVRERLDLVRQDTPDNFTQERLLQIDTQLPDLKRRLKMDHDAVFMVFTAILVFIVDMLLIALAAVAGTAWTALVALIVFLLGTGVLGWGVSIILREISASLYSVLYETDRVSQLVPGLKESNPM